MELNELFQPGMAREDTFRVEEEHSALHLGSGSLRVLATPWMIALMEHVSRDLLAEHLPASDSSVGVLVQMRHLAPTPVGDQVRVRAEIQSVEGRAVNFTVQAWDSLELVGEGQHQRVVIDEARFLSRVAKKSQQLAAGSENQRSAINNPQT